MSSSSSCPSTVSKTNYINIDLVEQRLNHAQTQKQKDLAPLHAHGLVQWLLSFYFPSKIRKSTSCSSSSKSSGCSSTTINSKNHRHHIVSVTSPIRGQIQIEILILNNNNVDDKEDNNNNNNNNSSSILMIQKQYEKSIRTTLKKLMVEDLGNLNATKLLPTIPNQDSQGRGLDDVYAFEQKLNVKVVFDVLNGDKNNDDGGGDEDVVDMNKNAKIQEIGKGTDHILIVGDVKKIEKKVFVIRNMISHYHWRLFGKDNVGV